ncbi:FAD-dependent oxidoreductase [Corallococcus sp. AB018]|uniref:FAD-dependent oxidoreductase n=1 Tax=Corallococcus sp. AB018 TaxID=2316715 RepID=UPI0013159C20|nr:FAD-dependent oxidoreductase [Corallococcus sp. AB018]
MHQPYLYFSYAPQPIFSVKVREELDVPDTSSDSSLEQRNIGPNDIIRNMEVPKEPGLYVLGCFERRVTLLSQQVRALNLVYALCEQSLLQPKGRVCVIGGGAAGMTVAAAAARRGGSVVLLEKKSELLPLFRGNHSRFLHPYIYDWPEEHHGRPEGVKPEEAGLPLLSWASHQAGQVARELKRAWDALPERANIKVIPNTRSIQIGMRQGRWRSVSWNAPGPRTEDFDVVVLAVGFGQEREEKGIDWQSYWRDDHLHQEVLDGRRRHLISGCGDGGLVDLLRVRLSDFQHETIVDELLSSPSLEKVKQRLVEIEQEALNAREREGEASSSRLLTQRYLDLDVPDDFKDAFQKRLRWDTEAVLNGREGWALTLHASILNRFLVSRLLINDVEYRPGEFAHTRKEDGSYEVRFNSGIPEHFHRIICRWGALSAADLGFPEFKEKFDSLRSRNELDQTRWRLWTGDYFGLALRGEESEGSRTKSSARESPTSGVLAEPASSVPKASTAPFFGALSSRDYEDNRQQEQEIYAIIIDEWSKMADIDRWEERMSGVFLEDQPRLLIDIATSLETLRIWTFKRIWPKKHPDLEEAILNFGEVCGDFLDKFHEHSRIQTRYYITERFYKLAWHPEEKYRRLLASYLFHVHLIEDLALELTRAANYVCDKAREIIDPSYRMKEGALLVSSGPYSDLSFRVHRPEYRSTERTLHPYPGLKKFLTEREKRNEHFGKGLEPEEG